MRSVPSKDTLSSTPIDIVRQYAGNKKLDWKQMLGSHQDIVAFGIRSSFCLIARPIPGRMIVLNCNLDSNKCAPEVYQLTCLFMSGNIAYQDTFYSNESWPVKMLRQRIKEKMIEGMICSVNSEIVLCLPGGTALLRGNVRLWPQTPPSYQFRYGQAVRRKPSAASPY